LRGKGIAMVITSMDSECPYDKALNILKELQSNTLHVFGAASFATDALDIACRTKRTFYESLYVALAIKAACRMVRAKLEGAKIDGAESKGR